jgi:hypothetical protein
MKRLLISVAISLVASYAIAADVNVSVSEVKDSRTTGQFFAGLEMKFKIMGDGLLDARGVKLAVAKATDDTGRDLIKKDESGSRDFTKPDENRTGLVEIEAKLKNPSRKASVVKEVSGEVTIFSPGRDPNAVASIPNFMTVAGRKIENNALKAGKVELGIMTKKEFDGFKEQQKKEVKAKEGEMIKELGEAMAKALGALFGSMMEVTENSVILNIADPDSKVVDVEFTDAAGGQLRSGSSMRTGDIRVFEFEKPMPRDAKLTVYLATPKALWKAPFKLQDIALP